MTDYRVIRRASPTEELLILYSDLWAGSRVITPFGPGMVLGWKGPDPIVELDDGRTVVVDFRDVRPDRTDVRNPLDTPSGSSYDSLAGISSVSDSANMRTAPVDRLSRSAGVVVSGG
jgi:hypothetical protein